MCGCCCGKDSAEDKADLTNPIKNRGCTDIIVLIVFVLFWAGMIYIAAFSITHGDAWRLVYGHDSFGNTCDEDNRGRKIENVSFSGMNMEGRGFVFILNILDPLNSMKLCVNKCPGRDLNTTSDLAIFAVTDGSSLCRYDYNYTEYSDYLVKKGFCPGKVFASEPLLNRCVPKQIFSTADAIFSKFFDFLNSSDIFHKVLHDLMTGWREMLILCFVALGFGALMVLLIRFLASFIVWFIIVIAIIGSLAGTVGLWWTYMDKKRFIDDKEEDNIPLLNVDIDSEQAFLIYSIIATVLTVILLLVILVMRKRISLTVTLFHEAGKCLADVPILLLQPLWTFVILVFFFVYWIIILAFLATAEIASVDKTTGFVKYTEHERVSYLWWYHLIGLIWTSEFIIACQQLVVSGTVATWYFTREKKSLSCTICKSTKLLIFHHLGSVAFGAFVITMVKLPRWILMYMQKKMKGSQNTCAQYTLKCCICCLWCLEKCLKYLNQNAYTVVAIQGSNFCSSAKKAFMTLVSNALRVAAINSVGDFVLFLGKIGVTAATAAVGIFWFKTKEELNYYAIPVLLVCVFAYFIAHCFLSTYEMVIDALLLCFCHDTDINDGSPERRYYASVSLQKYIEDGSNKISAISKGEDPGEGEAARL
ncbi:choline transporter-like protein 1 isoform X1 [Ostrea edulis]|uniref:choline transporter-like protein 1 isoform X1 n=1 Tax=Ostrea edulis TaxID=37623 RepID=UPI00209594EC|nr:choline transporter-like protein 1 isoform X1 [Ostrea edulis]XP_048758553.1 choline transporter-like protein 1 isoform X1 [Ostrea edulis]XP_048758554.1 choline transporter-like protein 1 isoform X1 [Ostrea edulis]XP_048758556.1 choline transporter-like protein 1 isoform X1 [Ostrea edulis]XP_056018033.1 choline transporter-like protein 1 isoform X1 [Ostrea edulis]